MGTSTSFMVHHGREGTREGAGWPPDRDETGGAAELAGADGHDQKKWRLREELEDDRGSEDGDGGSRGAGQDPATPGPGAFAACRGACSPFLSPLEARRGGLR